MFPVRIESLLCTAFVLAAVAALGGGHARADEKTLEAWEFNKPGDFEGWVAANHLRDASVADGVLTATVTDWDPFFTHAPFAKPIVASPTQVVRVRLNAPVAGDGEIFWTNTTNTQYGGFSPGKETHFPVEPGWHEYTIRPFWQGEGKILMLRLDLPGIKKGSEPERTYQIDYIRVVDLGAGAKPVAPDWSFDHGLQGFRVEGKGKVHAEGGWLVADLQPGDSLIAPPVDFPAEEYGFVGFEMSATAGHAVRLSWATAKSNGLHGIDVPLLADGKPHIYNVPTSSGGGWTDRIIYLTLQPTKSAAATVRLKWLRASADPTGPPELQVQDLGFANALPRAGRPVEVGVRIANRGGETLHGLRADLILPPGVKIAPGDHATKTVPDVDFYEPAAMSWKILAAKPGEVRLALKLSGPATAQASATGTLLPSLHLPKATYVPEPKPVHGAYDVGVYYFPGWASWGSWRPISQYPERKPVLGWYREGDPEVADWQIKFAVEHGVTFFCYDWYWNQGHMSLTQGLDAYFKARYHHLLKFCLLWANHAPTHHTPADDVRVCQYWIDNYFRRPEYYKLKGRPLMVIFSVGAMQRDLGIKGTKACIDLWHKMTRDAGVGEILVAGCGNANNEPVMKQMGFDAITGYNWPSCGVEGGRNYVPYIDVARKQFDLWWMPMAKRDLMPVIVPTSPGWDNRPWAGDRAFVLTDRTPAAFEEHLRLAKRFIDETHQPKVALVEAWNEFGEGSYCEPNRQYGFGHLDAIRDVFCPNAPKNQVDYGPADVGLGPYDVTIPSVGQASWQFSKPGDGQGWGPMMGLSDFKVADGVMSATTMDTDPAFSCGCQIRAKKVTVVEVRLSTDKAIPDDQLQLFWSTPVMGTNEPASVRVPLVADGKMHDYRIEVGKNRLWRGLITGLRLDPGSTDGAHIKIDSIRALP